MKKTLIALAALAVVSAASAQSTVTLSGKFGSAYTNEKLGISTTTGVAQLSAKRNGFGVSDGNVTFAASEDLGGGLKAGVSMDVRVRGRAAAGSVDGRDATVFVEGGFGRITLGAVEAGNGIIGLASAGAPVIGQDNGVTLDAAVNVDMAAYSTKFGAVTATVMVIDSIGAPGAGGLQGTIAQLDANLIRLAYAAGPMSVSGDYTSYGRNALGVIGTPDKRTRVSGSYNLGVATIGAGFQVKSTLDNVNDKQYMLGVSAPLGAVTVGATYAKRDNDNNALDATGYEIGANYALSKRTNVQVARLNESLDNRPVGHAVNTRIRVRLMHSF